MTLSELALAKMTGTNPDWASAPWEESGIADLDFLQGAIASAALHFKSVTATIELMDDGLFKYHLKQN